jgi:hypothetical protein
MTLFNTNSSFQIEAVPPPAGTASLLLDYPPQNMKGKEK